MPGPSSGRMCPCQRDVMTPSRACLSGWPGSIPHPWLTQVVACGCCRLRSDRSGGLRLTGPALTVDARGDLMSVIAALQHAGPGDVLVVSAGTEEHAVAGELFSTEALRRGLAGIVIDGRCRDSRTLAEIDLPVYARGVAPSAPGASSVPVIQVPLNLGGVEVRPGDILLGDDDGIVVGDDAELEAAIDGAETIQFREEALRASISAGTSLFTALNFDEHAAI